MMARPGLRTMNPYQSPPTIDDAAAVVQPADTRVDWIPAAITGLRWIQLGSRIVLFCISILVVYGLLTPDYNPHNLVIGSVFVGSLLGLGAIGLGLLSWVTVSRLAVAALVLHLIGGSGVAIYSDVMLRGRSTTGLIHLFGASTFAMMLTAQALATLQISQWTKRTAAIGISQSATLSVFGYAACAVVVSAYSLRAIPSMIAPDVLPLAVILMGVLSLSNLLGATRQTIAHLRNVAGDNR